MSAVSKVVIPAFTNASKSSTADLPTVLSLSRSPLCPPLSCQQPFTTLKRRQVNEKGKGSGRSSRAKSECVCREAEEKTNIKKGRDITTILPAHIQCSDFGSRNETFACRACRQHLATRSEYCACSRPDRGASQQQVPPSHRTCSEPLRFPTIATRLSSPSREVKVVGVRTTGSTSEQRHE